MESGFYWTSSMLLSIFLKPINAAITVLRTYGAMPKWSTTRVRNSNRTKQGKQRYASRTRQIQESAQKKGNAEDTTLKHHTDESVEVFRFLGVAVCFHGVHYK